MLLDAKRTDGGLDTVVGIIVFPFFFFWLNYGYLKLIGNDWVFWSSGCLEQRLQSDWAGCILD